MKVKPVKFFGTLGVVGLASFFVLTQITTDSEFGFEIPPPQLSVVQVGDQEIRLLEGTEIPSVACWANMAVHVLDEKGSIIATEKSGFFKVNPTLGIRLDLTDTLTGRTLDGQGGFELVPQMKCTTHAIQIDELGNVTFITDPIDPEASEQELFPTTIGALQYPSFEQPITIESNELVMKVFSQEKDSGFYRETYNGILEIDRQDVKSGKSVVLGKATIPADRIIVFMEDGEYTSEQIITLEGAIPLHWTASDVCIGACSNLLFFVNLETEQTFQDGNRVNVENPLRVTRDLDVSKNVSGEDPIDTGDGQNGGDGIDSCPSGQIRQGTVCVTVGNFGGVPTTPTGSAIPIPIVGDIVNDVRVCLDSGDPLCFWTEKFIGLYFIGIGGLLVLGAIIALATKRKDIYGVEIE